MEKKTEMTRREFLKDTALAGAGAAVLGGLAPARVLGANDRIRVGVLGSGHRARYVMEFFKEGPQRRVRGGLRRLRTRPRRSPGSGRPGRAGLYELS